jgi:tetrahydromethanopterin S-methyltransferase subunit E
VAIYIVSLMKEFTKEIKVFIEKTIVLTIIVANRNVMLRALNSYGLYKRYWFQTNLKVLNLYKYNMVLEVD